MRDGGAPCPAFIARRAPGKAGQAPGSYRSALPIKRGTPSVREGKALHENEVVPVDELLVHQVPQDTLDLAGG